MNSFNTFESNISNPSTAVDMQFNNNLYENTGLYGQITWSDTAFYDGYPGFFLVNTIDGSRNITNMNSLSNAILPLAQTVNAGYTVSTLSESNQIYHCQWSGYFKTDFSGAWTFSLTTVNYSMLWIGETAINNEKSNIFLDDTGNDAIATTATINLVNGKYYPIRIHWGKRPGFISPTFILSVTRNGTTITNLTSYLYSAKPNISTLVGMPAVFIKTTANTNDNLYAAKLFVQYSETGYYGNVVDFVQNNFVYNGTVTGPAYIANIGNLTEASTTLNFTIVHNAYSILYTGYFKADFTGSFTFNLNTDDETYLWIGETAIAGYTTANRLVYSSSGNNGSGSISLTTGTYYPIRILWGNATGPAYCNISFTRNSQTITDWTGYTFHPITATMGNPKMFI